MKYLTQKIGNNVLKQGNPGGGCLTSLLWMML